MIRDKLCKNFHPLPSDVEESTERKQNLRKITTLHRLHRLSVVTGWETSHTETRDVQAGNATSRKRHGGQPGKSAARPFYLSLYGVPS